MAMLNNQRVLCNFRTRFAHVFFSNRAIYIYIYIYDWPCLGVSWRHAGNGKWPIDDLRIKNARFSEALLNQRGDPEGTFFLFLTFWKHRRFQVLENQPVEQVPR